MAVARLDDFDSDLPSLRARLAEMGGLAEEQLSQALDAARRRDLPLARRVAAADVELDRRESAIEGTALRMLALRQPLAQELREAVAALKIATTLERVGDMAKNIARRAESLSDQNRPKAEAGIIRIGQLAQQQLSEALDAYAARDTARALEVWRRDIEIDELHNSVFHDLIMQMTYEPRQVGQGAQLLFIAKNLERVGDYATFIAEMTYYVAMGRSLPDERPKGDPFFGVLGAEKRPKDTD